MRNSLLDVGFITRHYNICKGVWARISKIEYAILDDWQLLIRGIGAISQHVGWLGVFCSKEDTPLLAHYGTCFFLLQRSKPPHSECRSHLLILPETDRSFGGTWVSIQVINYCGIDAWWIQSFLPTCLILGAYNFGKLAPFCTCVGTLRSGCGHTLFLHAYVSPFLST